MFALVKCKQQLQQAIDDLSAGAFSERSRLLFFLGRVSWSLGAQLRSVRSPQLLSQALAAADKLSTFERASALRLVRARSHAWLGQWYAIVRGDSSTATAHWRDALSLAPQLQAVGARLADELLRLGRLDECAAVLDEAASAAQSWPLRRLAFMHLSARRYEEAAHAFQRLLKLDAVPDKSGHDKDKSHLPLLAAEEIPCAHALADCYAALGRQHAAMRVIAVTLDALTAHASDYAASVGTEAVARWRAHGSYSLGALQLAVGQRDEALASLSEALTLLHTPGALTPASAAPIRVPTHLALAALHRDKAHAALAEYRGAVAQAHLDSAHALLAALVAKDAKEKEEDKAVSGDRYAVWKLLGDVLSDYAALISFSSEPSAVAGLLRKLEESVRAYKRAQLIERTDWALYADEAAALYRQALLRPPEERTAVLRLARTAANAAMDLFAQRAQKSDVDRHEERSTRAELWTLLGVCFEGDPAQQQHCFVNALSAHRECVPAHQNLALLALSARPQTDELLSYAQDVLDTAIAMAPTDALSWCLRGAVAELRRESAATVTRYYEQSFSLDASLALAASHSLTAAPDQCAHSPLCCASVTSVPSHSSLIRLCSGAVLPGAWSLQLHRLQFAARLRPHSATAQHHLGLHLAHPDEAEDVAAETLPRLRAAAKAFRAALGALEEEARTKATSGSSWWADADLFHALRDAPADRHDTIALSLANASLDLVERDETMPPQGIADLSLPSSSMLHSPHPSFVLARSTLLAEVGVLSASIEAPTSLPSLLVAARLSIVVAHHAVRKAPISSSSCCLASSVPLGGR